MTLIVQDSTGTVADANAYITREYFLEYHGLRGNALPAEAATDPAKIDPAIIRATQFADLWYEPLYPGTRLAGGQTTAFPRDGIYRDSPRVPITGLPPELLQATAELALRALQGPLVVDLAASAEGDRLVRRVREKVGPMEEETEYADSGPRQVPSYPMVELLLSPLFYRPAPTGNTVYR